GYGLRYGAGWSSWDGHYPLSVPFKPYRIMAAASSLEGNCLRGIAAESRLGAWCITTLAARQVSDGSLGQGESGLDWSDGPAGDHSKPGHQAIRGRSETGRYGLRLGSEKERGRFGLSLDAISVNTVPVDTLSLPMEYQDACLGADLQYHGPRSELGVEAAAWASGPMGIGLGFTLFPEGWIGVRIQWMLANGRLPLPEQFTNLAEASIFRESRTVSSYLRWGRGWELSFGIGQWAGYKPGAMDLFREERLYLLLNYVEGNVHGLRITLSAKAKEEDNFPGQARAHNTSLRCLWDRTIIPGLRLEGGHQLSLSRHAGPMVSGMGLWSGLRSGIDYGLLQALRFDLAFHTSRDADTRTYFWVSGPEGRIVMQTLYYDGWKA
ncbi:MAG: hypothetical protein IH599_03845, partial [Bacteroidales bacterium]|nr:hypothetical protein [Bacteroidales bacterium]